MIFVDTNVISESMRAAPDPGVIAWLIEHDSELALASVVIAEIAFGIQKLQPDQRASRLVDGLAAWRRRHWGRVMVFNDECAMRYGEVMGAASRRGRSMSAQDGMIAAMVSVYEGALATRNVRDFDHVGIAVMNPWAST